MLQGPWTGRHSGEGGSGHSLSQAASVRARLHHSRPGGRNGFAYQFIVSPVGTDTSPFLMWL